MCVCVCLNRRGEKEGDDDMAVVTVLTVGELRCVELFVPFLQLSSKFVVVV